MSGFSNLEIETREHIRIVAINRPEKRNAVDGATARELYQAFQEFDADPSLRVGILTGRGGAFCAGADLKALASDEGANPFEDGGVNTLAPMGVSRLQLEKPVIAAIEGPAVAGGLELALWCDLRVMAQTAMLGVFCRRFGVPLVDLGTIRLPRLIGQSRAMDLILTGRAVDAEEAFQIGLANRVVPEGEALEAAVSLAMDIAAFPQACMRSDRKSALEQWGMEWDEAIANETRLGMRTIESGETREGAGRFSGGTGRHGSFER